MSRDYFAYILQCADGSYYTGVTNDLLGRVSQHQDGRIADSYTHTRRPVRLAFSQQFTDIRDAINYEKQIKRWTRKKKEALIRSDWNLLKELAKRYSANKTRAVTY